MNSGLHKKIPWPRYTLLSDYYISIYFRVFKFPTWTWAYVLLIKLVKLWILQRNWILNTYDLF